MSHPNYQISPLLLIWEVTRSCQLACRHCRASAEEGRDPRELSLEEGRGLIDQVAALGTKLMVFTGGDPLQRPDLEDLIAHAKSRGLTAATIPAATDRLTRQRVQSLAQSGVDQLALSLDGATAAQHDDFRQVEGTFAKVMEAAAWIREAGVPLQINTVFGAWNVNDFAALAETVTNLGAVFWEIFFLVPTGRGTELQGCTPEQFEELFAQIKAWSESHPGLTVKVTEAQHYRRFFVENGGQLARGRPGPGTIASQPVNSGNGFCFVDHTGQIQPSGFLPLDCGNIRTTPLAEAYQKHPTFVQLRDLSLITGPCATCQHLAFCSGGSRARTYGLTGDFLGSDPFCSYNRSTPA